MDDQLTKKLVDWAINNPKINKFQSWNINVILTLYAEHHPKENIVPDFELKRDKIDVEGETLIPSYDDKIFEFKNYNPGNYTGRKFGWKGLYFGLNVKMLRLAEKFGFSFRVTYPEGVRMVDNDLVKKVLSERWIVSRIKHLKLNIYAVPIADTKRIDPTEGDNRKITDYSSIA